MLGTMRHILKIEKTDLDTRLSQLSDRFSRTKISRKFSKFYWTVALIVSYSHLERKKNLHSLWSGNSNFSSEPRFRSCIFPSYDSFFEKHFYESHMTHNICNIHIIWFQILFLIQLCKNFWDSPTQNFWTIFFSRMRGRNKILTSNSNST